MVEVKKLNNYSQSNVVIDPDLDKYDDMDIFKEKNEKAFAFLEKNPVPVRLLKEMQDRRIKRRFEQNMSIEQIAQALTAILNKYSSEYEWNRSFEENEITAFFNNKKGENKYWDNSKPSSDDLSNWQNKIHAAKLLEDLFNHFSESKLEYRKTTHSKELTEWLIENVPHELDELKQLLSKFY